MPAAHLGQPEWDDNLSITSTIPYWIRQWAPILNNEVSMMKRPYSPKAVIPQTISRLKQRARLLKREKGLSHRDALEMAAYEAGYPNWYHAVRSV